MENLVLKKKKTEWILWQVLYVFDFIGFYMVNINVTQYSNHFWVRYLGKYFNV